MPQNFLNALKPMLPEMLFTLQEFVVAESPSLDKSSADVCCGVIAAAFQKRGLQVERIAQKNHGDHLRISAAGAKTSAAKQLLVLGHYDTVYSAGTLKKMPFRVSGGKVYGPGTFDMKAGIVQALFAYDALLRSGATPDRRIVFLWTSDEEIGSGSSRKLIESEARRSDAVFVLEPSFGLRGLIKTARKAVGEIEIVVHGRASHAGLAPEEGINAIHELCHQLGKLIRWNDPRRGITVNADILQGGTRTNVIPEHARAVIDLRALRTADMRRIERQLRALRPVHRGARLEIRGGFSRGPLERKMSAALFKRAQSLAAEISLNLGECVVGGGSDGNLTAALGIPTLDGLGAVGHSAHSSDEHIVMKTMPQRAALLASLLATV